MAVTEIKNPTPIEKEIEKAIERRLFDGFNNWTAAMTVGSSGATRCMSRTRTTTSTASA